MLLKDWPESVAEHLWSQVARGENWSALWEGPPPWRTKVVNRTTVLLIWGGKLGYIYIYIFHISHIPMKYPWSLPSFRMVSLAGAGSNRRCWCWRHFGVRNGPESWGLLSPFLDVILLGKMLHFGETPGYPEDGNLITITYTILILSYTISLILYRFRWLLGTITVNYRILMDFGVLYFQKTPILVPATNAEERAFDAAGDIDAACVARPPRMFSCSRRTLQTPIVEFRGLDFRWWLEGNRSGR